MFWLASFPRSGNTFFRNVLHDVYGLASSTYHIDPNRTLDEDYTNYPIVKTHLLPSQLKPNDPNHKSVYLVRDGRDALVSIAHHRKDIVQPGTDFYNNLLEAILAQHGSYFGGWAENVNQWTERADIIIRFEDLIKDPIREAEKLRSIIDLPEPNKDNLPTFKKLKFGNPTYGARIKENINHEIAQLNFRKGKKGGWKKEMPEELEELFWSKNHSIMTKLGYARDKIVKPKQKKKILIEASKHFSLDNDGIKRYCSELVRNIPIIAEHLPDWHIDLLSHNKIKSLHHAAAEINELNLDNFETTEEFRDKYKLHGYEHKLMTLKKSLIDFLPDNVVRAGGKLYRHGPFRKLLDVIRLSADRVTLPTSKKYFVAQLMDYDLIHLTLPQSAPALNYILSDLKLGKGPKLVTTVHDLTHKTDAAYHTAGNIKLAEQGMQTTVDAQGYAIAISQSTKKDLINLYNLDEQNIYTVAQSANQGIFNRNFEKNERNKILNKYNLPDAPYFMCLSTIEPRKNLKNTISAFITYKNNNPESNINLVICGRRGWKYQEIFKNTSQPDYIYFTGFVDDNMLPILYRQAHALCYISHYEGFGLPLLEAMACGTPTIYGNNSSMPEVAGDTGLAANSHDIEDIAKQMQFMANLNEEDYNSLAEAAWRRSNQFTWMKTALETLGVYKRILAK